MSSATSPVHFDKEYDGFYDPNYTADISKKMRVPKRIRVTGEGDDEVVSSSMQWASREENPKVDMHVPDRIMLIGHDQHVGSRAPPREMMFENAVLPPDPGIVRVQTPPRVINLQEHNFPCVENDEDSFQSNNNSNSNRLNGPLQGAGDTEIALRSSPTTPNTSMEAFLAPSEELQHLRRQVARLNRRLMALELEQQQRQQRDKIIVSLGIAYFVIKTLAWLQRSSQF